MFCFISNFQYVSIRHQFRVQFQFFIFHQIHWEVLQICIFLKWNNAKKDFHIYNKFIIEIFKVSSRILDFRWSSKFMAFLGFSLMQPKCLWILFFQDFKAHFAMKNVSVWKIVKFIPKGISHFSVYHHLSIINYAKLFVWFSKWAETDFFSFFNVLKSSSEKNCARHKNMFKLCVSIEELHQIFGQLFIFSSFHCEMPSLFAYKKNCSKAYSLELRSEILRFSCCMVWHFIFSFYNIIFISISWL